jgi:mRNA interferase MazF
MFWMGEILFGCNLIHRQVVSKQGIDPPLVLSPLAYNAKTNLMLCCPLTTQVKSYPFEVVFTDGDLQSAVLADQLKSLDWKVRKAKFKSKLSSETMAIVKLKIKALLCL